MDRAVSAAIKHNQQNALLSFPDELLLHILGYIDPKKLVQMQRVCQRMRDLLQDRGLWEQVGAQLRPPLALPPNTTMSSFTHYYRTYRARVWLDPSAVVRDNLLTDQARLTGGIDEWPQPHVAVPTPRPQYQAWHSNNLPTNSDQGHILQGHTDGVNSAQLVILNGKQCILDPNPPVYNMCVYWDNQPLFTRRVLTPRPQPSNTDISQSKELPAIDPRFSRGDA